MLGLDAPLKALQMVFEFLKKMLFYAWIVNEELKDYFEDLEKNKCSPKGVKFHGQHVYKVLLREEGLCGRY